MCWEGGGRKGGKRTFSPPRPQARGQRGAWPPAPRGPCVHAGQPGNKGLVRLSMDTRRQRGRGCGCTQERRRGRGKRARGAHANECEVKLEGSTPSRTAKAALAPCCPATDSSGLPSAMHRNATSAAEPPPPLCTTTLLLAISRSSSAAAATSSCRRENRGSTFTS